jgi:hypothetical protein
MAGEKIVWVGDGSTNSSQGRARSVINATPASSINYFVYGGDIYTDGTALEVANFDSIYGSTAVANSSQDMRAKMFGHAVGNHEYHTVDASGKVLYTNDWWATHASTTIMGAPSSSLVDPNAVYTGLSGTTATNTAAAQWEHLRYLDVGPWRLLVIDAGRSTTDEGIFPTSGDYYDAVEALVNGSSLRRLIVFCHFPRFSAGSSHGDRSPMNPLWSLIAPKALAFIGGHDHVYNRHQPRNAAGSVVAQQSGCVQFVVGNSGTSLNTNNAGYTPALDYGDDANYGLLRITLTDSTQALFEYIHRGTNALGAATTADSVTLLSEAGPAQVGVPDRDITAGGWTAVGGGTRFGKINDTSDSSVISGTGA